MKISDIKFRILLWGAAFLLKRTARKYPAFRERLKEKNFTAQIKVVDNSVGRDCACNNFKIMAKVGMHS